ncbi:hypothetical protein ACVHWF_004947, partial [Escherichia coli]
LIAPFCEHLFSEIFNLLADIISELPLIYFRNVYHATLRIIRK